MWRRSAGRGVAVAALAVVFAGAPAGEAAAPVPVLGAAFVDSVGYGHAHPSTLSSGPTAATFLVRHIRWRHWGAQQATGTGIGLLVPPGKPISAGRAATKKLVAYDLGTCNGRRAYRRLDWWYPGHSKRSPSVIGPDGKSAPICR